MAGGKTEVFLAVLSLFHKDAQEKLSLFQTMPDTDTLTSFIVQAHAIKGGCAYIGAKEVSAKAAELEAAAKAKDFALLENKLDEFATELKELLININNGIQKYNESLPQELSENVLSAIGPILQELKAVLISKSSSSDIFVVLDKLNNLSLDSKTKEFLEKISYQVLMNEFDEAVKIIEEF
jgi:HPt (histidine-containing phosphotransfer) domain-containing protein